MTSPAPPPKRHRRWIVAGIVLAVVGACITLARLGMKPKPWSERDEARMCLETFDGIKSHDHLLRVFPRNRLTSDQEAGWRWFIERFVEDIHGQPYELDERWDSAANSTIANYAPSHFCSGHDKSTHVLAVPANNGVWDPSTKLRLAELPPELILFVVCRKSPFHWMQPGDITTAELLKSVGGDVTEPGPIEFDDVFWVCFADGSYWALRKPIDPNALVPFLSIETARTANREQALGQNRLYSAPPRS